MNKNNGYISPTHINKYVNCKYKWHYESTYSQKELSQFYKQYKIENGIVNDKQYAAFTRGNEFHSNYLKRQRKETLTRIIITIFATLLGLTLWTYIFIL